MRRRFDLLGYALTAALLVPTPARAQSAPPTSPNQTEQDTRLALLTVRGDTGIWFVPTSEVLAARKWSISLQRTNIDDGQGFSDISNFPVTFGVGFGNRAELFGSWSVITRIDRDTRPLFFPSTAQADQTGTGGGIVVDYPLVRSQWTGSELGDLWVGGKVRLLEFASGRAGIAGRGMLKLPVGNEEAGVSSGKLDGAFDAVVSARNDLVEIAGYGGIMVRGNPDGYQLTNGLRWGIGAASPQRYSGGFRLTTELFGEVFFDDEVTAPPGLTGTDGSVVPTTTFVKGPLVGVVGLTWQAPNGFFIGAAGNWNFAMNSRDEATPISGIDFPSEPKDDKSFEVRIGFHPGTRRMSLPPAPVAPPPPVAAPPTEPVTPPGKPVTTPPGQPPVTTPPGKPPVTPPGKPPVTPPGEPPVTPPGKPPVTPPGKPPVTPPVTEPPTTPPVTTPPVTTPPVTTPPGKPPVTAPPVTAPENRPPTVTAACDPCTVITGGTSTITATAADPDGDTLSYRWSVPTGTLADPSVPKTTWTAPNQIGTVPATVTVDDGKGGTATDTVDILVVQPAVKEYTFEDVHFDFDRNVLNSDSLEVLDELAAAMLANASLRAEIEGHTDNIGTTEYNLALGERRALAVRNYLVGRGIAAARVRVISYGEERPRYDNSSEVTRRLNRRAALVVRVSEVTEGR